jgi:hypothetical protein
LAVEKRVKQEEVDRREEALQSRSRQKQHYISYLKKNLRGQGRPAAKTDEVPVSVVAGPKPRKGGPSKAEASRRRDAHKTKRGFLSGGQGGIGYEMQMSPSDMDKSTVQHRMQALAKLGEQKVNRRKQTTTISDP